MSAIQLYDYQQEIIEKLHDAFTRHTSVMCQMPTGTGKTVVLSSFIESLPKSEVIWIVAHRRELVEQICSTLTHFGLTGVKNNGKADGRRKCIRVLSIQWLQHHWEDMPEVPSLIIIDEAHHSLADTYQELWKRYAEARKLGMTATPCRLNGASFTRLYDKLICSWNVSEFIKQGYLASFDFVTLKADSEDRRLIASLKKKAIDGDYQVKEMAAVLNNRPTIERLYQSVMQWAVGKKGIVYAINIEHAQDIAAHYAEQGLRAAAIDSKTPARQRAAIVNDFREGRIDVLVNVDIFSEGFDCPDVEFIQLARPTLSLSKYLQMVGRGLRAHHNKESCIIIDNVGCFATFGLPNFPYNWNRLFAGEKFVLRTVASTSQGSTSVKGDKEEEDTGGLRLVVDHEKLEKRLNVDASNTPKPTVSADGMQVQHSGMDNYYSLWYNGEELGHFYKEALVVGRDYGLMCKVSSETERCIAYPEGELVDMHGDLLNYRQMTEDFLLLQHGKMSYYLDMVSITPFHNVPQIIHTENGDILKDENIYHLRTRQHLAWKHTTKKPLDIEEHGFYTLVKIAAATITSDVEIPAEACASHFVMLKNDRATYYFLVEVLNKDNILVLDGERRLYRVNNSGQKSLLVDEGGKRTTNIAWTIALMRAQFAEDASNAPSPASWVVEHLDGLKAFEPYEQNGKWGLRSKDRIVCPAQYKSIEETDYGYYLFTDSHSSYGLMRRDGYTVLAANYTEIRFLSIYEVEVLTTTGKTERRILSCHTTGRNKERKYDYRKLILEPLGIEFVQPFTDGKLIGLQKAGEIISKDRFKECPYSGENYAVVGTKDDKMAIVYENGKKKVIGEYQLIDILPYDSARLYQSFYDVVDLLTGFVGNSGYVAVFPRSGVQGFCYRKLIEPRPGRMALSTRTKVRYEATVHFNEETGSFQDGKLHYVDRDFYLGIENQDVRFTAWGYENERLVIKKPLAVVVLPYDHSTYYYLCAELKDGSILLVSPDNEYSIATKDGRQLIAVHGTPECRKQIEAVVNEHGLQSQPDN